MTRKEYVTVDGEILTENGEEIVVTIDDVVDYIDASEEAMTDEIKEDIRGWFESEYESLSTIENVSQFLNDVYSGLSEFLPLEIVELVINLIKDLSF